jgi:tetratricopeptide (TPR) repeat protein
MVLAWVLAISGILIPSAFSALDRGDQEFASRDYGLAMAIYDSALTTSGDSAAVLWRLARVVICIADVSPESEQLELYRRAEAYAVRSISCDPTRSEGHTWRAAALGSMAVFEGSKAKVRLCVAIKQELFRAIELNPEDDIAFSILGSFYRILGGVGWFERQVAAVFLGKLPEGGYEESERALKQAIALAPRIVRHHFELGLLYQEMGRNEEALEEFRSVLSLPLLLSSDTRRQLFAARVIAEIREN